MAYRLIALLISLVFLFPAFAIPSDQDKLGLEKSLAVAKSPADSLKTLCDIYQLSDPQQKQLLARQIFQTALHAKDGAAYLDFLRDNTSSLELQRKEAELVSSRNLISYVLVGWIIFTILLVVLLFFWGKHRRMAVNVDEFAYKLARERHYLKKMRYPENMEAVPYKPDISNPFGAFSPEGQVEKTVPKAEEYINNNFLYICSIGKGLRERFICDVSISDVMRHAADMCRREPALTKGLKMTLPANDIKVHIDQECLEYTAARILRNALIVQQGGAVDFHCELAPDGKSVSLVFHGSSVCIPPGEEEMAFGGFVDMAQCMDREDPGMFTCRLSATLLSCSIAVDPTCQEGAKCIFTIPVKAQD